jgi:hypothetical protein
MGLFFSLVQLTLEFYRLDIHLMDSLTHSQWTRDFYF